MNDNILGERLEECRKKAGLTQQQLASELCVQRQIISYYENGSRKPDVDMLKTLAKRFNVTTDYLLGLTDIPTTDRDVRFIGDYTGLNETAINGLHNLIVCASKGESDSKKDLHVINGVIALFKKEAANELALG